MADRELPNAALRLLFLSIEEVMGKEGMKPVLNGAGLSQYIDNYPPNDLNLTACFSDYGHAEQAVEDFYGPRGARALLLRVGRNLFQYSLKEQSGVLGIASQAFRSMPFLPMQAKMRLLLQQMVAAADKTLNQPARLEETDDAFIVVIGECMCEYRPRHGKPCCLVTVGTFGEAVKWLTERPNAVEEITCLNNGADACRYRIPKHPIE